MGFVIQHDPFLHPAGNLDPHLCVSIVESEIGLGESLASWADARDQRLHELFEAHYRPLCRLAFLILHDPSRGEEVVMDAFVKLLGGWRRVGSMERPDLYLRRSVVNGCSSRLRRLGVEVRARAPAAEVLDLAGDRIEASRLLRDAIEDLPKRQRLCVLLRYFEDLPEAEISEILQVSPGTIKSQLSKARAHLRRARDMEATSRGAM